MGKMEQLKAQLIAEKARQAAAESKWMSQYQNLAQNNTLLARKCNRLTQQNDALKAELNELKHHSTGHSAVYKAKESEYKAKVDSLQEDLTEVMTLLSDCSTENESLRAQLAAKQDVNAYLEFRLAQMQTLLDQHGLEAPKTCFPSGDSFDVLEDHNSGDSVASKQQQQTNKNNRHRLTATALDFNTSKARDIAVGSNTEDDDVTVLRPLSVIDTFTDCKDSVVVEESDENLQPIVIGGDTGHVTVRNKQVQVEAVVFEEESDPHTPQHQVVTIAGSSSSCSPSDNNHLVADNNHVGDDVDDVFENDNDNAALHRYQQQREKEKKKAASAPQTAPRTSTRVRNNVSYALPSVNSKLRQGDKFTFGDVTAFKGNSNSTSIKKKSQGGSRTKPRASYSNKSRRSSVVLRGESSSTSGVLDSLAE